MRSLPARVPAQLQTHRLLLRRYCAADLEPLAALNADPVVMECFPAPLTRAQTEALIERLETHFDAHGFGFWALEEKSSGALLGFTGIQHVSFAADFAPAVEIGWRLGRSAWGQGYASEAARAALQYAFANLQLDRVVSFTAVQNQRSRAVMERLGMQYLNDFDHPLLPQDDRLQRHVLYAITPAEFQATSAGRGDGSA
jgi:ribosomal-protein-alanine N-acetyltransferase